MNILRDFATGSLHFSITVLRTVFFFFFSPYLQHVCKYEELCRVPISEKQELTHHSPINATTSTGEICTSVGYFVKIL